MMTQTGATAPAYLGITCSGTKTEFYKNLLIAASGVIMQQTLRIRRS